MANIAFTTLIILLLAAPGAIARASYFSHEFTRQVLPRNWTDDIARAILWSIPFHFVGAAVVEFLQHCTQWRTTMTFLVMFRLLSGEYDGQLEPIVARLYENAKYLTAYYGLMVLFAFGIGHLFRWVVWRWEWDIRWPKVFAFRSPWLYTLMGRGKLPVQANERILVYVDALTDLPANVSGRTILYRGLVSGFSTNEDGTLQDILLTGAYRGKFDHPQGWVARLCGDKPAFSWQPIEPGNFFALRYSEIKNLNITYEIYPPR